MSYHTQRNNENDPFITCNTTSLNTVLEYFGVNMTDDQVTEFIDSEKARNYAEKTLVKKLGSWFAKLLNKHRQREAWLMIEWCANIIFHDNMIGVEALFDNAMSINKIIQSINKRYPVICHLAKRVNGKAFGHYVVAIGYDLNKKCLIFHDPFGDWLTDYDVKKGAFVEYPNYLLQRYMSSDRSIIFRGTV